MNATRSRSAPPTNRTSGAGPSKDRARRHEQPLVIAEGQIVHLAAADIRETPDIRPPRREDNVILRQDAQVPGSAQHRVPGIVGRIIDAHDSHCPQCAQRRAGQRCGAGGDQDFRLRLLAAGDDRFGKWMHSRRSAVAETP